MVEDVPMAMEAEMMEAPEKYSDSVIGMVKANDIKMANFSYTMIAMMNLAYNLGLVYRYGPTDAYTAAKNVYGSDIFKWLEWIYAGMNYSYWAPMLVF